MGKQDFYSCYCALSLTQPPFSLSAHAELDCFRHSTRLWGALVYSPGGTEPTLFPFHLPLWLHFAILAQGQMLGRAELRFETKQSVSGFHALQPTPYCPSLDIQLGDHFAHFSRGDGDRGYIISTNETQEPHLLT